MNKDFRFVILLGKKKQIFLKLADIKLETKNGVTIIKGKTINEKPLLEVI